MNKEQETKQRTMLSDAHDDYAKALNNHAFFKVNDKKVGEDLVQNTFLKTWSHLIKGGKIDVIKKFLYHVLNNLIIDEYRKRKFKMSSLDDLLEKGIDPTGSYDALLSDDADGKEAIKLINDLPMPHKQVIHMRYVQGFSIKEISAATGDSENVIYVQIHRGIKKLRELYKPTMTGSSETK